MMLNLKGRRRLACCVNSFFLADLEAVVALTQQFFLSLNPFP